MTDNSEYQLPFLPYRQPEPSSGHSGTETSADRAVDRDSTGKTAKTQAKVLDLLSWASEDGLTIAEVRDALPSLHHGTLSGTLSNLHRVGAVSRLAEVRNRCKIYVLPKYVGGRKTESQGHK